jgi:hypothetical protein
MKKAGTQEIRTSFPAFLLSSFSPSSQVLYLCPSAKSVVSFFQNIHANAQLNARIHRALMSS